jgi:putative ABC transport system ATP-binding protein
MDKEKIVLENISKTYGEKVVLNIKKEEIHLNKIVAILGVSGSGKSTLLNILSLIDFPDPLHCDTNKTPSITWIFKDKIYEFKYSEIKMKRNININMKSKGSNCKLSIDECRAKLFGYVFQEAHLHPNLNFEKNIKTPLFINGETIIDVNSFKKIIEKIEINGHMHKYPENVSGGERQRASILRGLINESPVTIGDELTSNLDHDRAVQIIEMLHRKRKNRSFLWVTHDTQLTSDYAEKILTINQGKIKEVDNPGEIGAVVDLLKRSLTKNNDNNIAITFKKRKATFAEMARYFISYAMRDLFKKDDKINMIKPTADFGVSFFSLVLIFLFILTIMKMGYANKKFLEVKLSDPRINNIKLQISSELAEELTDSHLMEAKEKVGKRLRHITPIYRTNVSIKKYMEKGKCDKTFTLRNRSAFTFEANDPVLNSILIKKSSFINNENDYRGIIIDKNIFRKSLKYPEDAKFVCVSLNNMVAKELPVVVTSKPLPLDAFYMIRKELHLEAYQGQNINRNPQMSYILLYPKDIHETRGIIKEIKEIKSGNLMKFSVKAASDLDKKIEVLNELEDVIGSFSRITFKAIFILSLAFLVVTVYRNINKKRKEIGVFLANGMKKSYFYIFYFLEAFILWALTSVLSLLAYFYLINDFFNDKFTGSALDSALGKLPLSVSIKASYLNLPYSDVFYLYIFSLIILSFIFIALIHMTIKKLPVALMKDL